MTVEQVADSISREYSVGISSRQYFDVVKHFPAMKTSLPSWQAVCSTSINITYTVTETSSNNQMLLRIAFDLLHNTDPSSYCLAKYDQKNTLLLCDPLLGYSSHYDQALSSLTFKLSSPGAYAVIFFPNSPALPSLRKCQFLCKNFSFMVRAFILSMLLVIFIVWCCYKLLSQLKKLQQSKDREKRYKANLDYVLSLQGSQVQGEGVKDMQLGIFFKKNPAYRATSSNL